MNTTKTILLIDDDPHIRHLIGLFLRRTDYHLISAGDGESGLRLIREKKPAAILLDRMLPGLSGDEVLRRLRHDPAYREVAQTPVIVLTALSGREVRQKTLELGANAYLTKPVTFDMLTNQLESVLYHYSLALPAEPSLTSDIYELLVENIHDLVFVLSASGQVMYINPRVQDMLGYPQTEMSQRYFSDFVYPDDVAVVQGVLSHIVETGELHQLEIRMLHKDNSLRYMELTGKRVARKDQYLIMGSARDVTVENDLRQSVRHYAENLQEMVERRTYELELAKSEITYLFQTISQVIAQSSIARKIEVICEALVRDRFYQQVVIEIYNTDNVLTHRTERGHIDANISPQRYRYPFYRQDETVLGYLEVYNPLIELSDEVQRMINLFVNVIALSIERAELESENEAIHKELVVKKLEADELSILKSEFMNNVGHEFRTPLAIIIGYLDVLTRGIGGKLNARQAQMVQVMRENADKLHRLIQDILDFSQIQLNGLSVAYEPCAVPQLILSATARVTNMAKQKNIALTYVYPHDLPEILLDPSKTARILHVLLDNAVKFTDPGGTVTLEAVHNQHEIRFRVKDSGHGIAEADREKIFEPFRQGDGSTIREHGGTGLGLSFAKHLTELLEGELSFTSVVGQGTTFEVAFPLRYAECS
ncbi:MAG: response regulator [Gemmatimonadetes bacterium]|nr:MAG: response regulator [Gemmatimonadota bacterium]